MSVQYKSTLPFKYWASKAGYDRTEMTAMWVIYWAQHCTIVSTNLAWIQCLSQVRTVMCDHVLLEFFPREETLYKASYRTTSLFKSFGIRTGWL